MRTIAVMLALLVTPAVAHAEPERSPERETRWYGWQPLAIDAATLTVLATVHNDTAWELAAGTFLLTGPIAHAAHGNWGTAFFSLAWRAAVPVGGGLIGMTVRCAGDPQCAGEGQGFLAGMLVGAVAASAFDGGLLAYEKVDARPKLTPLASITSNGATFGLAGIF